MVQYRNRKARMCIAFHSFFFYLFIYLFLFILPNDSKYSKTEQSWFAQWKLCRSILNNMPVYVKLYNYKMYGSLNK